MASHEDSRITYPVLILKTSAFNIIIPGSHTPLVLTSSGAETAAVLLLAAGAIGFV